MSSRSLLLPVVLASMFSWSSQVPRLIAFNITPEVPMITEGKFYSVKMRLESCTGKVELLAYSEDSAEPDLAHIDHWESLSGRLTQVASSTPFHLKIMHRTLHAGLIAPLIDRATGVPQVFSHHQLKALGLAS